LTNKLNISAPTAIQGSAVPQLLQDDADVFIQAETGSGKTLAYLLPIIQRLMNLSSKADAASKDIINRDSGLFAIILAPTRELSKQIYVVLESVLRCAHWIVPGIVIGGEKKKSEKARLRKGVNILVATPGRLVDHLQNTEVLEVSNVRWLILDEGDRLMELGFEEDIKKISSRLDFGMKKKSGPQIEGLPSKRINVLCSATMKMDVQRLGEISLREAVHIQAKRADSKDEAGKARELNETQFLAPAQLKQSYAVVPAKLRLVTLVAMLKRAFSRPGSVMKAIVFLSCADSVDFHFDILTRQEFVVSSDSTDSTKGSTPPKANEKRPLSQKNPNGVSQSSLDPSTYGPSPVISNPSNAVKVYRLHGSLPQLTRTKTLRSFSEDPDPSFLVCTDVASRGLDLPSVDLIIEYDPPFSKDEHLHRIGRTARAGRDGRANIFLLPGSEEGYVDILKDGREHGGLGLTRQTAEDILRKGLVVKDPVSGKDRESGWDERATDWQLSVERWVLESPKALESARRAFQSHVRAYATHVAAERHVFNIKELHLGHLCKAFGLRDRPGSVNVPGLRQSAEKVKKDRHKASKNSRDKVPSKRQSENKISAPKAKDYVLPESSDAQAAVKRMRAKMKMIGSGADEFNLA
jgi:ATP-dependent RNA helicase DDX31/DBP7